MSGIGFSELIILFVIGLIVLGPERLPRVANQLGGWIGQARRMTRIMKQQLEDELDLGVKPSIRPPALQAPRDNRGEDQGEGDTDSLRHDDAAKPTTGGADEQFADEPKAKNRDKKNNEMTAGERHD